MSNMKKILLVCILVIIIVIGGVGGYWVYNRAVHKTNTADATKDWEKFDNTRMSFKYPKSWHITSQSTPELIQLESSDPQNGISSGIGLEFLIEDSGGYVHKSCREE